MNGAIPIMGCHDLLRVVITLSWVYSEVVSLTLRSAYLARMTDAGESRLIDTV